MRRFLLGLLAVLILGGCGAATVTPQPTPYLVANTGAPLPSPAAQTEPPTAAATPSPTPSATPSPKASEPITVWARSSAALHARPGEATPIEAHVGPAFPLTLTGESEIVASALWEQVRWKTPGRTGTSWVETSAVTSERPEGPASASIDALDADLAAYLAKLGDKVGVEVYDVTRGVFYASNADHSYIVASSIKVPIMDAFLDKLEGIGREPTTAELGLLKTMIQNSNNNSATALWLKIGGAAGLTKYIKKIGVRGLKANPDAWGWSTFTPAGMVQLLTLMHEGKILNDAHRALAFNYMGHIQKDQQVGVQDTAPAGSKVVMKVGWVNQPNGLWAMNSHGIVTYKGETWVISVYTGDGPTLKTGFDRARHVCEAVADGLTHTP